MKIFEALRELFGNDSPSRKSARYFRECEEAFYESQKQQEKQR